MTSRKQSLRIGVWVLGMIVAQCATPLQAQDSITLDRRFHRSSKLFGKITSVSRTSISIETNSGGMKQVPANQIKRINLADEPSDLSQARNAVLAGQYEQAADTLNSLKLPDSTSDLLRQELAFYRSLATAELALRGTGDLVAAEKALMDFLKRERATYHFFAAVHKLGDLATASGRFENAAKYYSQLAKAPWPDYELKSFVLQGNALRSQAKWELAAEQYDRALKISVADPISLHQQTMARVGKAACEAALGDAESAIEELNRILAKHDESNGELFAETYLALGSAYQKAGLPMDAILSYLHVDLLFYRQRDAHAEALYHLAELWPVVDEPARGVEARKLLVQRYAGSLWASRANQDG